MNYMEIQYALFNQKIIKCKLKSLGKANNYNDIKQNYANCEVGVKTYKRFVD